MKHLLKLFSLFTIITMMTTALIPPTQTFATQETVKEKMDRFESMKKDHEKKLMKDHEMLKNAEGFEEKKAALINIVKLHTTRLNTLATHLTERQCGDPEKATTIIATISSSLTEAQTSLEAATTIEELRTAHMKLKETIQSKQEELKEALKSSTKGCVLDRVSYILEQYTTVQTLKAQEKIEMLKEQGLDTTEVETAFAEYTGFMTAVQALYDTANTATEISRADLKAIKNTLHDAKEAWEDMIQEMRKSIKDANHKDEDEDEDKSQDENDDQDEGQDDDQNNDENDDNNEGEDEDENEDENEDEDDE